MDYNEMLIQAYTSIINAVKAGGVLAVDTAKQYVEYTAAISTLNAVLMLAAALVSAYALRKAIKSCNNDNFDSCMIAQIFSGVILVFMTVGAVENLQTLVKAKYAPNILVIEKMTDLIKKVR